MAASMVYTLQGVRNSIFNTEMYIWLLLQTFKGEIMRHYYMFKWIISKRWNAEIINYLFPL